MNDVGNFGIKVSFGSEWEHEHELEILDSYNKDRFSLDDSAVNAFFARIQKRHESHRSLVMAGAVM